MTRSAGIRGTLAPTVVLALGDALRPAPADAHLITTGLGPIYDGISHVLLSPDDLLPVLAMALLAGLNGPGAGRRALFALTGAWLLAGTAGAFMGSPGPPGALTSGSFLVLGGLTAMDRRLSPPFIAGLAIVVGLLHGWSNGVGIAAAGREALALAGIAGAVFVLVAVSAALVVSLERAWARVAVRVAGSWVAAIGLLMLGWWLRGT